MGCGCKEASPITEARWQEAQDAERGYWYPSDEATQRARRDEEASRAQWIASFLLDITPDGVAGRSVLDIGGGPQPIVAWPSLPLARRILLDPMPLGAGDLAALSHVERVAMPAEDYEGEPVDEVWGYNVLQHVRCPKQVLARAMQYGARRIRWFEWVNQPPSVVHPHIITPALIVNAFAPLRRVMWTEGTRDEGRGWRQKFVAGVWERA